MVAKKRLDERCGLERNPIGRRNLKIKLRKAACCSYKGGAPCVPSAGVRLPAIGATSSIVTLG